MSRGTFYVTTPIYYVNDVVHMGHAYSTIAADALARHKRQDGYDVRFLTGTDEHGVNIVRAAEAHGVPPQAWCDRIADEDQKTWEALGIRFDVFQRTTDPRHVRAVQSLFAELHRRGHIYRGRYEGLYCAPCENYYTETEAKDSAGTCPVHKRPLEAMSEACFFLRVGEFVPALQRHLAAQPSFVRPDGRRNEVLGLLAQGLPDLSISRKGIPWGVPVPPEVGGEPGETIYVWFDAIINYATGAGYPDRPVEFAKFWPANLHIVGKEIIKHHCVYWPIMLMAAGLPLPRGVYAHGWWTVEGAKISKTAGNMVDPRAMAARYGADAFRYYLMREIPFGADGDFRESALIRRVNVDLANDFGNLLHRTLSMLAKFRASRVPPLGSDAGFAEKIRVAVAECRAGYDEVSFERALGAVWALADAGNLLIEQRAPWRLNKEGREAELDETFSALLEALRAMAILAWPVLPGACEAMWAQLGLPGRLEDQRLDALAFGTFPREGGVCAAPTPLFPRIETEKA